MKLMILGPARHGKDTVCNILRDEFGLGFESSSYFVAERAVKPYLADRGICYPDFDSMYADRINHRDKWFNAIAEYNRDDPTRLGRELFSRFDIYCGIRNPVEFKELRKQGVIDYTFWVDRSLHVPPEPDTSNKMTWIDADYTINNNGSIDELHQYVVFAYKLARQITGKQ